MRELLFVLDRARLGSSGDLHFKKVNQIWWAVVHSVIHSQRDPSRQRPGPTAAKLDSDRTTGPTAANQKRKTGTDRQR